MSNLRAAADKRAADIQDRLRAVSQVLKSIVRKLKARFVDRPRIEDGGLGYLENLVGERVVVTAFG